MRYELIGYLSPSGMTVTEAEFIASGAGDTPRNLMNIANFNSLIAQSQKRNNPVFALTHAKIEQSGVILETMSRSRERFSESFKALAARVTKMVGI